MPLIIVHTCPLDIVFDDLVARLTRTFRYNVEIVGYEDDEQDRISILDPGDLVEAFSVYTRKVARQTANDVPASLKLFLRAVSPFEVSDKGNDAVEKEDAEDMEAGAFNDPYWNNTIGNDDNNNNDDKDKDVYDDPYWNKTINDSIVSFETPVAFGLVNKRSSSSNIAMRMRNSRSSSIGSSMDSSRPQISFTRGDKVLGTGAFGTVYQGLTDDGEIIAVKELSFPKEERDPACMRRMLEIDKEISLLKRLDHHHIIRYLGSVKEVNSVCICLEFADGGSLSNLIRNFGALPENLIRNYTRQMLLGLDYLHKNSVVHRDVKSANILLDEKGKVVKLSDFGCSKIFKGLKLSHSGFGGMYGTPNWMAPEVISNKKAGRASDVWSLGCVVVEMMTAKPPWSELPFSGQKGGSVPLMFHIASTKKGPFYPADSVSSFANKFLQRIFNADAKKRPNVSSLLEHGFIVNAPSNSVLLGNLQALENPINSSSSSFSDKNAFVNNFVLQDKNLKKAKKILRELVAEVYSVGLLGSQGVGKTSSVVQFVHSHVVEFYAPKKEIVYQKEFSVDEKLVNLEIFDPGRDSTAGALLTQLYEKGAGFILFYSISDKDSFKNVAGFVHKIRQSNTAYTDSKNVPILLVGNKADANQPHREVAKEEGERLKEELGLSKFVETSSIEDESVGYVFHDLVRYMRLNEQMQMPVAEKKEKKLEESKGKNNNKNNNNNNNDDDDDNLDKDNDREKLRKKCIIM